MTATAYKYKLFSAIFNSHTGEHNFTIDAASSDTTFLKSDTTFLKSYLSFDIEGTRDRFAGEIIPVGATQSHTKDDDEANNGAELAIDGDYSSKNEAVTEHGEFPWLKISLGRIFCVQTVVRRNNEDEIWQTWTCNERECTGVGNNAGKFRVTINTEGATLDLPPISDCSFGDTVTYGRKNNNSLGAREIVIIAREPMEVLYLGKIPFNKRAL